MPFFVIYNAMRGAFDYKEEVNRAEILDAMRERRKRLNWS